MIDEYCEHYSQKAGSGCLGKLPAYGKQLFGNCEPEARQVQKRKGLKTLEKQHMKVKFPYMN